MPPTPLGNLMAMADFDSNASPKQQQLPILF
jgi:hypothetical protein